MSEILSLYLGQDKIYLTLYAQQITLAKRLVYDI